MLPLDLGGPSFVRLTGPWQWLAAAGGGFLLFWKPDDEKTPVSFKSLNIARGMDISPDLHTIATAHHDRNLRITKA